MTIISMLVNVYYIY